MRSSAATASSGRASMSCGGGEGEDWVAVISAAFGQLRSRDRISFSVTLSDAAATALTATAPIVSGTYKPTNVEPGETGNLDSFPAPAPAGPYSSPLSVFRGFSPNGTWLLYVVDDGPGDQGSVGSGWSLTITTTTTGPAGTFSVTAATLQLLEVSASGYAKLRVEADQDLPYVIEASDDLRDWVPLGQVLVEGGVGLFKDTRSGEHQQRFYRLVSKP